ncbi:MAG: dihydrolipoamide dehydrogenase, partial [Vicinamibacteria bacterium]
LEATLTEIGRTVHAHPTLSEAVMEAALGARGESRNQ